MWRSMDFNLDSAGKHTLMLRGTLADNAQDSTLAQFPGQAAPSQEPGQLARTWRPATRP